MSRLMSLPPIMPMVLEASTVISHPAMSWSRGRRPSAMSKLLRLRWPLLVRFSIMVTDSSWAI